METTAAARGQLAWPKVVAGFAMVARTVKSLLKTPLQWLGAAAGRHRWPVSQKGSLLILTYHRVLPAGHLDRETEQPGMYVSPETLAMHLEVLAEFFEFVHLDDWVMRTKAGETPNDRCCAITFDDGWLDNYEYAWPVLQAAGVPATCFLVSQLVGTNCQFWPNRLAAHLYKLNAAAHGVDWPKPLLSLLAKAGIDALAKHVRVTSSDIDRAIQECKSIPDIELISLLDSIDEEQSSDIRQRHLLNWTEVKEMAESGLIRFGSHTRTHARLNDKISSDALVEEVVVSQHELESKIGQKTRLFCYPNGEYSGAAVDTVREHYDAALSTRPGWNTPSTDAYLLQRIGLHEDTSADRISFLSRVAGFP